MSTRYPVFLLTGLIIISLLHKVAAEIMVTDDAGIAVSLSQPAGRIISLAPNLTELLFSAGAGDSIVATVSHSDYPAEAGQISQIGDAHNIDIEAVVALEPELVLVWQSGNSSSVYSRLKELGLTVYQSEPDTLEKIGSTILRLGKLAGTESIAVKSAGQFFEDIRILREEYTNRTPVRVFYQFWDKPIYTVNGHHLISRIIELCGGENIYSDLGTLTPQLSTEAVLASNPDVIIGSGSDDQRPAWLDDWALWPELSASRNQQLYFIPPDYIQRHTTRVRHGAKMLCEFIDRTRKAGKQQSAGKK